MVKEKEKQRLVNGRTKIEIMFITLLYKLSHRTVLAVIERQKKATNANAGYQSVWYSHWNFKDENQ